MSAVDYLMPSFGGAGPFSSGLSFGDSPFLDRLNTDPSPHEGLGLHLDHKLLSPYEEPPPSTQLQNSMAPPMTVSPSLLVTKTIEPTESRKRRMDDDDDCTPPPQPKRQDSRDSPRPTSSYHREIAPASAPTIHRRFASSSPARTGYISTPHVRNAFSQSPFRGQTPLLDTNYGWGSFDTSNDLGSATLHTPYSSITGASTFTSSPGGMGSPQPQSMSFAPQSYATSDRPHSYSGPSSLGFPTMFSPEFNGAVAGNLAFQKGSMDFGSADAPRQKPQCWDHGCNGRQFSTFSNLLRHQRERAGTAAKAMCPRCHAKFTRTTAMKGHLSSGKCRPRRNSDLQ